MNYQDFAAIQRKAAGLSLKEYMKASWHVIEPGRPLVWNWHLDAFCDHFQAAFFGQIRRLLVTTPPQTTKSRTSGAFLPSWSWLLQPWHRWLFVSTEDSLATRESLACRRLVESEWYRREFQPSWKLAVDQNNKTWYETTAGGHRLCRGINAHIVGKKGDTIVIDDPNDAVKALSAAERARVINAYEQGICDRLIDFVKGTIIVIGQRTHEDDLIGYLKRGGGWFELKLQEAFKKSSRFVSPLGWTDPRRTTGELLMAERLGVAQADEIRNRDMMRWETKHQQEPRPKEGIRFKRKYLSKRWRQIDDYIHLVDERGVFRFRPKTDFIMRFITADGASSAKTTADYTCISTWVITERFDLVWVGCVRVQAQIPDQPAILQNEYDRQGVQFAGIETVLNNVALTQFAQRTAMVIKELDPKGLDKLARATPAIVLAEAGRLWLPDPLEAERIGFPLDAVLAELLEFTGTKTDKHDDIVDTLAYAADLLNGREGGGSAGGGISEAPKPSTFGWLNEHKNNPTQPNDSAKPGFHRRPT